MSISTSSLSAPSKVTPAHLARDAYVYVRQSSPKQVRENLESQRLQYQLADRAVALGWARERVHLIDTDQGQSGAAAVDRAGFQFLAAEVSLGRAGLVLALEVSRLARNGRDWYHLLELCALFGTLLADADGIYEPRHYNDRLLLGLKGTMSEAELHLIRQRLDAGRRAKAARGELIQPLPTGYVRDAARRVVLDPDTAVQSALRLVFERFATLGTAERVVRYLRRHDLALPRRQLHGEYAGQVLWKPATAAAVGEILRNPAYAGAFVYGRRPVDHTRRAHGRRDDTPRLPVEAWAVCLPDVYPAYITWAAWEQHQQRLRENRVRHDQVYAPGVPREGRALLSGLARCGSCGLGMRVSYRGYPVYRYICDGLRRHYAAGYCPSVRGPEIDDVVRDLVFAALADAELDLLDELLARRTAADDAVLTAWQQRVERAQYEARLAERRYKAVDPENRLVAAELERLWNVQLVALDDARRAWTAAQERAAQERGAPWTPDLKAALRAAGLALPALWAQLTNEQRGRLLRTLVRHVVITRPRPQLVRVRVVWVTGHHTDRKLIPRVHGLAQLDDLDALLERIRRLRLDDHQSDREIAARLEAEGMRSPRGRRVTASTIRKLRLRAGLRGQATARPSKVRERVGADLTIAGLARLLGVDRRHLAYLVSLGVLPTRRDPATGIHLITDTPETITAARAALAARPGRSAKQTVDLPPCQEALPIGAATWTR